MSLPTVNLDDRDFSQLMDEAIKQIAKSCPQWNDFSAGDPGIVLVELFAYLTESMIYRLNRLPHKVYIEFLRLLGVKLEPPSAATTSVKFTIDSNLSYKLEIPQYTRISAARAVSDGEIPVFITTHNARIEIGTTECIVEAIHGENVDAELVGYGTGLPGLFVKALHPPIVLGSECIVGVEISAEEVTERLPSITYQGKIFQIWQEVENFANSDQNTKCYIIDRMSGMITFPPEIREISDAGVLLSVPETFGDIVKEGKEIRVWYVRGGGITGNLDTNTLTVLKDHFGSVHVTVTNIEPATGGAGAESLENALIRGPLQFRSLERAVTASDFEMIAKRSSREICRAFAFTKITIWKHAIRGTVEIELVPSIPQNLWNNGHITKDTIVSLQKPETIIKIQSELEKRSTLGITILPNWVKYKLVKVQARVVVNRGERPQIVKERVLDRLYKTINPIPSDLNHGGWTFDTPLRVSNVYDIILAEAGVKYADSVKLSVDSAPSIAVKCIQADSFQLRMWYASSGSKLFRSSHDGDGWVQLYDFGLPEEIRRIETHPKYPGLVAICTVLTVQDKRNSKVYISFDCGENVSWRLVSQTAFEIEDITWTDRDSKPIILLAADTGLYELLIDSDAIPVFVVVDPQDQARGFYSVTTASDNRGISYVAVSSQKNGGVFLSQNQGRSGTYSNIGLRGEDIRLLKVNQYGGRTFLWAGSTAAGTEIGKGCFRLELGVSTSTWTPFVKQWIGGSCFSLAFVNEAVYAGSHNAGVLRLNSGNSDEAWNTHPLDCGLPFKDRERIFEPVYAIDSSTNKSKPFILVGGPKGVFRSSNFTQFDNCSQTEFTEKVTLPPTWLFCSDEHSIDVVGEDETE